ncbi:MAG: 5-formyltetrahydrofolate cyclo-ligase [Frankiaceae bacterium]
MTDGDPVAIKRAWRRRLLAARRARSPEEIAAAGPPLARRVLALAEGRNVACVAGYVALPGEPPTVPLLAALLDRGTRVLLPRLAAADLEFVEWDGGPLGAGGQGTRAPVHGTVRPLSAAQLVVAPALAADQRGVRLGRGGGGYDRALAQTATDALVVALLWDGELVAQLPAEPHDQPVAAVVSPTRTVHLPRPP